MMNFLLIPWIQLEMSYHFAGLHEEISCLDQEAFDQISLAVACEAWEEEHTVPTALPLTPAQLLAQVIPHCLFGEILYYL